MNIKPDIFFPFSVNKEISSMFITQLTYIEEGLPFHMIYYIFLMMDDKYFQSSFRNLGMKH